MAETDVATLIRNELSEKLDRFIKSNRKICWEAEYQNGEYAIGENQVKEWFREHLLPKCREFGAQVVALKAAWAERDEARGGITVSHRILDQAGVSRGHEVSESPNSALVTEYPVCDRIKIVVEENRRMTALLNEMSAYLAPKTAGQVNNISTSSVFHDQMASVVDLHLMVDGEGIVQDIPKRIT
jgi:hypothetical protein